MTRGALSALTVLTLCALPVAATAQSAHGHDHAPAAASTDAVAPAVTNYDRILGDADAPVTVIEYASFTCGHCADWHEQVFPAFKARFIDTGQVRFIHRDLPTPPRELAVAAAMVARCAPDDRFYAAVDALMDGQEALYETEDAAPWLIGGAMAGQLTPQQLDACLTDDQAQARIQQGVDEAVAAGVRSTPTFFVNGVRVADGLLETLEAAIAPLVEQGG